MSIDQGSVTLAKKRRTNEIRLSAPFGPSSAYSVLVNREETQTDADNNLITQRPVHQFVRELVAIAAQTATIPINGTPTVITAAELMAGIIAFADTWDQEEIDAGRGGGG